jgi:superfamily I DNA/RNA helicase/RecB family exonuclease
MEQQPAAYRLVRRPSPAADPPRLDDAQQEVVAHRGGPLLVLAGPGTGKTTTIVEAVVDRIERRGTDPQRILVLTFSRKAAHELRERITARLRRTTREPLALTFHSYAYALVRREFVAVGDEPPRLLSGPEQLLEIRQMLRGEAQDGGAGWPAQLRPALATRGFAEELRDLLLRAAERGLDGAGLARLGHRAGREEWAAAGGFLQRYAARFDLAPVPAYDYAEIIRIAAAMLTQSAVRARERDAYDMVLVDEYQDTDPAQAELLYALASGGRDLIAVGDPDQSIYGFRGADVRAILGFPEQFRTVGGAPAPMIALRRSRRGNAALLAASRRVAARLPAFHGGGSGHRDLVPVGNPPAPGARAGGAPDRTKKEDDTKRLRGDGAGAGERSNTGDIRIVVAESASQEAAVVADTLRRAHLEEGIPWSRMAVLVRSARLQVPLLRRALTAASVPATVAGDEVPLVGEPAVQPLLLLLRCALHSDQLDGEAAADLLTGPLGGTDALGLRRLRRALRSIAGRAQAAAVGPPAGAGPAAAARLAAAAAPPPSGDLIADALRDPRDLILIAPEAAAPAQRIAGLLAAARRAIEKGGTAEDVLWTVWDRSDLAARWQALSAAGGARGAIADRDLDAVLALFDAAARHTERLPPGAPGLFLESLIGQEIPGDTLAEQAAAGEAVRVLTAHRSKGLEWDVVVVAGVQEGTWPDLRMRGSLLGVDELVEVAAGSEFPAAAAAALSTMYKLLAEERRLFYVAVTRARRRLVVTAVGGDDTEERPSRFLRELAGGGGSGGSSPRDSTDDIAVERVAGTQARWLSLPALVASLRSAAADVARPDELRAAAAAQLARLAAEGVRGANPREWYVLTELSDAGLAVGEGETVRLSPSQVESFAKCGLRWLLEAAAGARSPDVARNLGTVIHAAAALAAAGAEDAEITQRLDESWRHLDFGSAWYSEKRREDAHRMVRRFLDWHRANPRKLVAIEEPFRIQVGDVEVTGRVDRLETDDEGRAVVVDLKTGTSRPSDDELDRHPQLGVYQLAVLLGAFERFGLIEPGGAELVQVGKGGLTAKARVQRQSELGEDEEPDWPGELVRAVAEGMAGPVFKATINPGCRTCPVASCCPVHQRGGHVTP